METFPYSKDYFGEDNMKRNCEENRFFLIDCFKMINSNGYVSEGTRKKVEAAIEKLNYALAKGNTKLGVIYIRVIVDSCV